MVFTEKCDKYEAVRKDTTQIQTKFTQKITKFWSESIKLNRDPKVKIGKKKKSYFKEKGTQEKERNYEKPRKCAMSGAWAYKA